MYLIARDSGFSTTDALELATLDEYTDWDPDTDATHVVRDEQRRLYHFPCALAHRAKMTKRNSPFAKHNINEALTANDRVKLGIALHVYMDSFSHEGFGQEIGHIHYTPFVHYPDEPFIDPQKFKAMTDFVYLILKQYRTNNFLPVPLRKLSSANYYSFASYAPDYWQLHQLFTYNSGNLAPRMAKWLTHIQTAFAGDNPAYAAPTGDALTKFNAVVDTYGLPPIESECNNREWATRGSSGYARASTLSVRRAAARAAVSDEKLIGRIVKMPVKKAARFLVFKAPQLITDARVQAHLVNNEGLGTILDLARAYKNPLRLFGILTACDWSSTDYVGQWEARLNAKSFRTRMFCANLFFGYPAIADATAEKLRALYQSVANRKLSAAQRHYLTQVLPNDAALVAAYAPAVVNLYQGLLRDPKLTSQAAAALYLIGAEKHVYGVALPAALIDATRLEAITALREWQDDHGDLDIAREVQYWTIRSYEDFDGVVHNSALDQENLSRLAALWTVADTANDRAVLQSAAIALSTYDKLDVVPAALVTALEATSAKSANADIAMDINYAVEQVLGDPME